MALRSLLPRRAALPVLGSAFVLGTLLYPTKTLHAEAPPDQISARKPIYDYSHRSRKPPNSSNNSSFEPSSPTPTDHLAAQVRHIRLFIHAQTAAAEERLNLFMSSVLLQERSFTQTIASLAPPPESHEHIMPGSLYILVAAMMGSIISRNRNIFLRASAPAAIGLGAAWIVLPAMMRNIGDMVWAYEEKAPIIALNHMRIRGALEEGTRQFKIHTDATRKWSDERVKEGREAIEGWVRKGR